MPARSLKPKCLEVFALLAALMLVPVGVKAQRVTLQGSVSETVALSVLPNFTHDHTDVHVVTGGNTVRVTLSSTNAKSPVLRVPLLLRSNTGFKLSASVESQTAVLTHLSILDVRPTGSLVSPEVVNSLVKPEIEVNDSQPLLVLSGPRVSLGGTLNSPNNALQVTLLIRMRPEPGRGSLVHLTFTATAAQPTQ